MDNVTIMMSAVVIMAIIFIAIDKYQENKTLRNQ